MRFKGSVSRRQFFKIAGSILGATALNYANRRFDALATSANGLLYQNHSYYAYLSLIRSQLTVGPRVIHVHAPDATSWDFGNDYYGNFVDQIVVDEMVDQGVKTLTGASSVAEAWQMIIPAYTPGLTSIAIKANFNNNFYCDLCQTSCADWQLTIDALIHPINAVIKGLKDAFPNFLESDIWVYDATIGSNPPVSNRHIPGRFKEDCLYPGVRFFDQGCNEIAGYNSPDPSSYVNWNNPPGIPTPPPQKVTDVLVQATYLINIPILKKHGGAGITLGLKNHFGSIDNCPPLHNWTYPSGQHYSDIYNPLVDINLNSHILNKTVLTIGDGLFGDRESNTHKPSPWSTFGGAAPNSLFFSADPVAIDSVMCDFLHAEGYGGGVPVHADDHLRLAEAAGLGVFERGDPWQDPLGGGYNNIEYLRLTLPLSTFIDVPPDHWAHDYIEVLYQEGYTAGCNIDPPMYCPDRAMNRAESAVFVERGIWSVDVLPPDPPTQIFDDVPLDQWYAKWATALWEDGYTAGCWTDPMLYCPLQDHTRAEGSVFYLRMLHGSSYIPPEPVGIFADVPLDKWFAKWVEAAYNAGIIDECQKLPEPLFCPDDLLTRALAAYMMVMSKGLPLP